ncbi:MAG: FHA domain-containing protein [Cyanobacteria bacterium P01_G01_bin.54]
MIVLTLLHPSQSTPVQSWVFDTDPVVRLGRGNHNDVVLYSAVVSRRHAELRQDGEDWQLVNLGANGTYLDGELIEKTTLLQNGMIIRLGESGPKIRVHLGAIDPKALGKVVKRRTLSSPSGEGQSSRKSPKIRDPKGDKSTFLE